LGTSGALVIAYAELMKEIWLGSDSVLTPKEFKYKLEQFAPQFAGGSQQDAQEFLSFLLDGIHEDLNRVQKKPYIEDVEGDGNKDEADSMKAWQNYLMRNKSVVVDIFQGQLRTTLQCTECSRKVVKFDPFMYLSLPLSKETNTLDDCLNLFCQEESLHGDNQWYCSTCKKHVNATTRTDLWTLPPILIVHLKRFKQDPRTGTCSKLKQSIKIKLKGWDLDDVVARQTMSSPVYDLYAVSNHLGNFGSGHYTAYAINRVDDLWYDFNDSRATKISDEHVAKNDDAYVLFFNRVVDTFDGASDDEGDADASVGSSRAPVIVRQSINRPEHWPHLMTDEALRNYKRPVSVQPVPASHENGQTHESTIKSTNIYDENKIQAAPVAEPKPEEVSDAILPKPVTTPEHLLETINE
jgi:ubiquitin carboxyl-terminal hydrolase 8